MAALSLAIISGFLLSIFMLCEGQRVVATFKDFFLPVSLALRRVLKRHKIITLRRYWNVSFSFARFCSLAAQINSPVWISAFKWKFYFLSAMQQMFATLIARTNKQNCSENSIQKQFWIWWVLYTLIVATSCLDTENLFSIDCFFLWWILINNSAWGLALQKRFSWD